MRKAALLAAENGRVRGYHTATTGGREREFTDASKLLKVAGPGQIVEAVETHQFQKSRRGDVDGFLRSKFRLLNDGNEAEAHKLLKLGSRIGAALAVDIRFDNRLTIRDECEDVASRSRQSGFPRRTRKSFAHAAKGRPQTQRIAIVAD